METFEAGGALLEFEVRGDGPPLLLVHGSVFAEPWEAMLSHADLLRDYQVVTYRRRGYGEASSVEPGRTLSDEGADAVALLDHVHIERAHVVGHSLAADIVLQVVIDSPHRFATMTLLEPGLFSVPSAVGFDQAMSPVVQIFESGDHRQAMMLFLGGVGGADVLARLEARLPAGAVDMAVNDVPTLFGSDIPAGSGWVLDEDAARSLPHPTLLAVGSDTGPIFRESNELLTGLLAKVEHLTVAGSGHFVHVEQAQQVADGLAAFLRNHDQDLS